MIWVWLQNLRGVTTDWFRYYIVFSKAVSFNIFGLVFSHSLIEYAVTGNLMTYLTDLWKKEHLSKAVMVVNVLDGLSTVMVIVVAHVSDAYLGHFKMVVLSTLAYIFGLVLLLFEALNIPSQDMEVRIVYLVVILIALGKAGREVPIKALLCDQLRQHEPNTGREEEQVESRINALWLFVWFLGAVVASFGIHAHASWPYKFKVSTIVMGAAYLLFLSGVAFYYCIKPTVSPLTIVFRVFKLDKAAILVECSSPMSPEEQEQKGKVCTVAQVREVKNLLKMVPMWTTFLTYSLVQATGRTFFIKQGAYMDGHIGRFTIPVVTFLLITTSFSKFIIILLCNLIIPKISSEANRQRVALVRIACGLVCSILCCITAWWVEVRRLHVVHHEIGGVRDEKIGMSMFWLTPQFCLLGFMAGFAEEGLGDFFKDHVAESMRRYGPAFRDCVLGIGKFLSIPCVLICRSWFKDTLNESHLDRYYIMLAMPSVGNLFFYWYVSNKYYKKEAPVEEEEEVHHDANLLVKLVELQEV